MEIRLHFSQGTRPYTFVLVITEHPV